MAQFGGDACHGEPMPSHVSGHHRNIPVGQGDEVVEVAAHGVLSERQVANRHVESRDIRDAVEPDGTLESGGEPTVLFESSEPGLLPANARCFGHVDLVTLPLGSRPAIDASGVPSSACGAAPSNSWALAETKVTPGKAHRQQHAVRLNGPGNLDAFGGADPKQ